MDTKLKILALALAVTASSALASSGKKNKEEWKTFKECKQRVEQGAKEDCSALKPAKGDKDWKKDGKKGEKNGKKCNKKD